MTLITLVVYSTYLLLLNIGQALTPGFPGHVGRELWARIGENSGAERKLLGIGEFICCSKHSPPALRRDT